jgi:hypothetical protein
MGSDQARTIGSVGSVRSEREMMMMGEGEVVMCVSNTRLGLDATVDRAESDACLNS